MQDTRLNRLTDNAIAYLRQLAGNPWRRLSLIAIGLLVGFFLASAVASGTGQAASWDITAAAVVLLACEAMSRIAYAHRRIVRAGITARRTFAIDFLNAVKIGTIYGLFLEAFKLNS